MSLRKLEYLRDTLLAVDEAGLIAFIASSTEGDSHANGIKTEQDVQFILSQQGWELAETQIVWLKRGEFIIPGCVHFFVRLSFKHVLAFLSWLCWSLAETCDFDGSLPFLYCAVLSTLIL